MWRDSWHIISVRKGNFKYIWDNKHPNQTRLYDIESDPDELHNLSFELPEIALGYHLHVDEVLIEMERTMSRQVDTPELNEEMLSRLRDLGYIQ